MLINERGRECEVKAKKKNAERTIVCASESGEWLGYKRCGKK